MRFVHNSDPFECAKLCDKTLGCFGTVFLFTINKCHLKSRMEISGPNFNDLQTTDLYFRSGGSCSKYLHALV